MRKNDALNTGSVFARSTTDQQDMDVCHRLYGRLDDLPTALARIAKYIVENPEKVVRQSVSELSEFSGSGEASIIRLCRLLNFSGFREFKLALAVELGNVRVAPSAESKDGGDRVERLHASFLRTLDIVRQRIDSATYQQAAELLAGARRIDIFGTGVSGIIGELLSYRLLRLGFPAQAFRDGTLAHEVADGLGANCVAVAISESGLSENTVRFVRSAKAREAWTIAITNQIKSPLASKVDVVLHTASYSTDLSVVGSIGAAPGMVFAIEALALALIGKRDA